MWFAAHLFERGGTYRVGGVAPGVHFEVIS